MFLFPNTITTLRHVWEHPSFEPEFGTPDRDASERWLRAFCESADCPAYEIVIAAAIDNDAWDDDCLHFDGRNAHGQIPPEFWDHVAVVTGRTNLRRAKYFSCSC